MAMAQKYRDLSDAVMDAVIGPNWPQLAPSRTLQRSGGIPFATEFRRKKVKIPARRR
jgi:hypothetical protein